MRPSLALAFLSVALLASACTQPAAPKAEASLLLPVTSTAADTAVNTALDAFARDWPGR